MTDLALPNPSDQAARAYFDAAAEGRLALPWCLDCGKPHFYPRVFCPHCGGAAIDWRDATGGGTVYSYSVMGDGQDARVLAFVTLDEGITLLSRVTGSPPDRIAIGNRVSVVFREVDGGPVVPDFRLEDGPDA